MVSTSAESPFRQRFCHARDCGAHAPTFAGAQPVSVSGFVTLGIVALSSSSALTAIAASDIAVLPVDFGPVLNNCGRLAADINKVPKGDSIIATVSEPFGNERQNLL